MKAAKQAERATKAWMSNLLLLASGFFNVGIFWFVELSRPDFFHWVNLMLGVSCIILAFVNNPPKKESDLA